MIIATFFSYQGNVPKVEYELLNIFVANFKKSYPDASIVILTDEKTAPFLKSFTGCSLEINEIDPVKLLLCRSRIYSNLVKKFINERILLIDYDILSFNKMDWPSDVDLAYTIREKAKKQPINGGVIFVNSSSRSIQYFDDLVASFENLSEQEHRWWGDQIAVWNLISNSKREGDVFLYKNIKIKVFDSERYNWTPHDMQVEKPVLENNFFLTLTDIEEYKQKFFVHFKGPRKHLMNQYMSLEGRQIKNSCQFNECQTDLTFLVYGFTEIEDLESKLIAKISRESSLGVRFKIATFDYINNTDELTHKYNLEIVNLKKTEGDKFNLDEFLSLKTRYISIVNLCDVNIDLNWYITAIGKLNSQGLQAPSIVYGNVILNNEKYLPRAAPPISLSTYEFSAQLICNWMPENSIFSTVPLSVINHEFKSLNSSQIFLLISALYRIGYVPGVMGSYRKLLGRFNRIDVDKLNELKGFTLLSFRQLVIMDLYLLNKRYGLDMSIVLMEIIQSNRKMPQINNLNFWDLADLVVEFCQVVKLNKILPRNKQVKMAKYDEIMRIYSQFSDFRYRVCADLSYKTDFL